MRIDADRSYQLVAEEDDCLRSCCVRYQRQTALRRSSTSDESGVAWLTGDRRRGGDAIDAWCATALVHVLVTPTRCAVCP